VREKCGSNERLLVSNK